jgi:hypothetical protein
MEHDKLWYEPDNDYPIHDMDATIKIKDGKIGPRIITGDDIIKGINYCCSKLLSGGYNAKEARMYLKQLGLHTVAQEKIISTALQSMQNEDYDHEQMVSYKLPASWYGFEDTTIFVDVPMHLLMLGVVKSVMGKINKWLRKINKNTMFVNKVSGILLQIKKMNIEWCKVLEYPRTDKTGGWVSENFVAMTRLCVWFYSVLKQLPINEQYTDPTTVYTTWNKKECHKWLQVRGIDNTGKIIDLKKQIGEYMESDNVPSIQKKTDISIINIMDLISSTQKMIKTMISEETTKRDIKKLEAIIRLYLIHYDKLDCGLRETLVPSWIQQYNMVCLLNIPRIMLKYGTMRNVWEGGKDGEAYLKQVKHNLKSGLVNQWHTWVLTNLLKEEIYDNWKTMNQQQNADLRLYAKIYVNKKKRRNHIPVVIQFQELFTVTKYIYAIDIKVK